jgi:hypothetical protein
VASFSLTDLAGANIMVDVMDEWISIEDRLPEDAAVIVYAPSADPNRPLITIAWHHDGFGWSLLPEHWCNAISHWMPLPKPPMVECE